ncbi:MAG TPA: hypothetical protein VD966_00010 [Pyrinomonadaceae bacterium]|nr:hypothetical protein [Pyrinomonadaceae bacterium]
MIAALLILSAAICATAQSNANVKPQSNEKPAVSPSKQNARERGGASPAGQNQDGRTNASPAEQDAGEAVFYSYEFKQPEFLINHVLIEHDGNGRGKISFKRKSEEEPYVDPLELSSAALARIKALWDGLRFLDSETSYQTERQYPHLGTIWLRMKRGGRERTAEFNWTSDRQAFALVTEYRRVADQALFIFDITVARQNQPLEAPGLMDRLDALLNRGGLSDPQQLVSLLRDLRTDERIPLMARNRAERILKKIEKQAQ